MSALAVPFAIAGAVLAVLGVATARDAAAKLAGLDVPGASACFGEAVLKLASGIVAVAVAVLLAVLS